MRRSRSVTGGLGRSGNLWQKSQTKLDHVKELLEFANKVQFGRLPYAHEKTMLEGAEERLEKWEQTLTLKIE